MTDTNSTPFDRSALVTMRDSLSKEKDVFLQQMSRLRQAVAETETNIQRTDGALVVVEKLLAGEGAAKPDPDPALVMKGKNGRGRFRK